VYIVKTLRAAAPAVYNGEAVRQSLEDVSHCKKVTPEI